MKTVTSNSIEFRRKLLLIVLLLLLFFLPQQLSAHCDSYDGPVVKDAYLALETNNVAPVLKWIEPQFEEEITELFEKTQKYKNVDEQVYELLEKHFLETLVRVHRQGEGETFTGLKPAGNTPAIIQMTDAAIASKGVNQLLKNLNAHISAFIKEKYERLMDLKEQKEESVEQGRAYVAAYVDYTHTVEAIHKVLEHEISHQNSTAVEHKH